MRHSKRHHNGHLSNYSGIRINARLMFFTNPLNVI